MPDFELSITICSWNTVEDLRACLQSLKAEAAQVPGFEVIVVDNASEDGSPDMVESEFPEFRLLRQTVNLGFTGGHNLAIAERAGRHVALLNSDTVVHPGAVRTVLEFMEGRPDAGVVGPKLLNPDGSLQYSCRKFPDPLAAAFRNTFLGRWFPDNRYVRDYLMKDVAHDQTREVDWVSGAAMFIRDDLVDAIGGLDDRYFMYCEDTDFCKRTWEAGYKVVYLPTAVVTHAIGRSTDRVANKMIVRFHKSMFRFYRKHLIPRVWVPLRPGCLLLAALALSTRAGLFLAGNAMDALKRRFAK
ncbi:MAG: glycosyltransferase family 2 protein [Armatimonadetes bacterium]|nr:glycosyltransferase family 2 protein [Armatimonadota bacterium]